MGFKNRPHEFVLISQTDTFSADQEGQRNVEKHYMLNTSLHLLYLQKMLGLFLNQLVKDRTYSIRKYSMMVR